MDDQNQGVDVPEWERFCEIHHVQYELFDEDPPGYEIYDCPVCHRDAMDALHGDNYD